MQKCDFFFNLKWPPIAESSASSPNFALHSRTTQDMCVQDIIGISAKLRALGPEQTHIGPTHYVGPNYEH